MKISRVSRKGNLVFFLISGLAERFPMPKKGQTIQVVLENGTEVDAKRYPFGSRKLHLSCRRAELRGGLFASFAEQKAELNGATVAQVKYSGVVVAPPAPVLAPAG